jgi:hypothetical protein
MRYAYHDLGEQQPGTTMTVRWSSAAADVLLLDPVSFSKYCRGQKLVFRGGGGRYSRSPARLSIPETGRWFIVVDVRGYSGNAEATVEVQNPNAVETENPHEEPLVEIR